jgi:hypothetical protein
METRRPDRHSPAIVDGPQTWRAFVWREKDRLWMILMGENAADRTIFGLLHSTDGKT